MIDSSENQGLVLSDPVEDLEEQIDLALSVYNATLDRYRAGAEGVTQAMVDAASDSVKILKARLGTVIATGATNCPSCYGPVFGMRQPTGFEIGCPNCRHHRARGHSRRGAVRAWNDGPKSWVKVDRVESGSVFAELLKRQHIDHSVVLKKPEEPKAKAK